LISERILDGDEPNDGDHNETKEVCLESNTAEKSSRLTQDGPRGDRLYKDIGHCEWGEGTQEKVCHSQTYQEQVGGRSQRLVSDDGCKDQTVAEPTHH